MIWILQKESDEDLVQTIIQSLFIYRHPGITVALSLYFSCPNNNIPILSLF